LLAGRGRRFVNLRTRTAITGLLLAIVVVGVGTSGHRLTEHGPWRSAGGPVAAALELVLAVLLLTLRSIRRREPQASFMIARLRLFLHRTISSAMVVVAAVVVSSLVWPSLKKYYANPLNLVPQLGPSEPFQHFLDMTRAEEYLVFAGLTLLVVVITVVSVRLLSRSAAAAAPGARADDDGASLHHAVESGLSALDAIDDARAAIIACYRTMEESLGTAGAARYSAETSAELLNRAVRAGLLHGPAASRLTQLFYEARYSTHELPAEAKEEARRALEAISADLQPRATGSGPTASAAAEAVS